LSCGHNSSSIAQYLLGVFTPTCGGLGDLTNLSLSRLQIALDGEDSAWGINSISTKSINGYELGLRIGLASYRVEFGVIESDLPRFGGVHPADRWAVVADYGPPGGQAGWAEPVGWLGFGPLG
jgi:hypothetical protein